MFTAGADDDHVMCRMLGQVSAAVWREDFWLPNNYTWDDLQNNEELQYPSSYEVWLYPVVIGALLALLNHWWLEPSVIAPLAKWAGLSALKPPHPPNNSTLESLYKHYSTKVPQSILEEASRTQSMGLQEAERWLRDRKRADRTTKYDIFLTLGTSLIYNVLFLLGAVAVVSNKPWLWNIRLCWEGYPILPVGRGVRWNYLLITAHYYCLLMSEAIRPRRKNDGRLKIMLHHVFTLQLLTFSWVCNFTRVGMLVLLVHLVADIPLLIAKMCKYAGREAAANVFFACFLLSWLATRCYLYPFWVMHSVFFEATAYMFMPSAYVFLSLLIALLGLNLSWTFLILRMVFRTFITNTPLRDLHDDDDEDDENGQRRETKRE
ncbi:ceramide synthase 6-like [Eriocheir sinensis]|uniref:ceramide synthase 6-like n=1 Tax=Eriocheir sinensis TaxID=95602 RepID=UPI0021C567CD|nr:ceramide synthase 6-like [Eriocheir sinensis]XP_050687719.1 ceramide synthase 6-like [Eriocheir sinensis]